MEETNEKARVIAANPYVLQELTKPEGEREHEILSRRRRGRVPLHGYPLSGFDAGGRQVLIHSDEKERFDVPQA
jgi:hypothetical protein